MTALRLFGSAAVLIAAGLLLFVAGFGIYFAISIASDGIGGNDEQERFTSALIEAGSLPAGVALLVAGSAIWQRSPHLLRALVSGIGLMLIPVVAAWMFGLDRMTIPIHQLFALELPLALSGLAAVSWLRAHDISPSAPARQPPGQVVVPGQWRRIASLVIALIATVPLVPLVLFLAAINVNPLEAGDEPNVWAGVAFILLGIGGIALVVVTARALVRPHRSMSPFVAIAVWFAFSWFVLILAGGAGESTGWEEGIVPILSISLPVILGWLSRSPET